MNIDQIIAKLEADEPFTPAEVVAIKETINDKDINAYGRIQDALQIIDVVAQGSRSILIERLLENLSVTELEEDLIPPAATAPSETGGDGEAEGVDGAGLSGEVDTPPPAADTPVATVTIKAEDIDDAKRAAEQGIKEDEEEKTSIDEIRPPEVSEEETQALIDEQNAKDAQALKEKEEAEAKEKEEAEAKEKEEAEAKEKAAAEAEAAAKEKEKFEATADRDDKSAFLQEACERHDISDDYKKRLKKYIGRGQTVAQLKDGSRRLIHRTPAQGGRNEAERSLGADLDFIWNDYL